MENRLKVRTLLSLRGVAYRPNVRICVIDPLLPPCTELEELKAAHAALMAELMDERAQNDERELLLQQLQALIEKEPQGKRFPHGSCWFRTEIVTREISNPWVNCLRKLIFWDADPLSTATKVPQVAASARPVLQVELDKAKTQLREELGQLRQQKGEEGLLSVGTMRRDSVRNKVTLLVRQQ